MDEPLAYVLLGLLILGIGAGITWIVVTCRKYPDGPPSDGRMWRRMNDQ